ncbi:MAG: hypothetical protein J0L97_03225 [Alphaproteobacteria bacterium]|nr:hypothetical protein [Alphaproteobacteria bacterium]
MSFVTSLRRSGGAEIQLIQGADRGTPAWYYLRIDRTLLPILAKRCAEQAENVDLTRFGEVLASGFGDEPPPEVKTRMEALANGEEFEETPNETVFYFVMADDPQGRKFHAYIALMADRAEAFEQWAAHGDFDLKPWGLIVEGGFGKPSAETMVRMQEEYGLETPDLSAIPEDA